jgi:hypothetical protein
MGSVTVNRAYASGARAQWACPRGQQIDRTRRRADSARAVRVPGVAVECDPGHKETPMETKRPDPNDELNTREPLRIIFALVALLLGLLAALHA